MTMETSDYLMRLADLGVTTVRYLHCDHFEPWRRGVTAAHADELALFRKQVKRNRFASKMTLFYKPHVPYTFNADGFGAEVAHLDGEPIGFPGLTEDQSQIARDAMHAVAKQGHEIQLHMHHEGYTLSDVAHFPQVRAWLTEHGTKEADSARLRIALAEHLKQARCDTGHDLSRWLFVHGNWALNGSDHSICQIADEMQILKAMGCVGDFTFPAGRKRVNPDILMEPYTCETAIGDKSYNTAAAAPRPVTDPSSRDPGRFFIWHSDQLHPRMSLDIYASSVQALLETPDVMVDNWLAKAPVYGDTIYVKTYAHSMNGRYFDKMDKPIIPHADDRVRRVFASFENVIARSGLKVELTTAMDVFDTLMHGQVPVKITTETEPVISASAPSPRQGRPSVLTKFKSIFRRDPASKLNSNPVELTQLDAAAVEVMRARIETMGVTESGAYNFYKVRVERNELVTRHERELVDAIYQIDPDVAEVVDIGSGIGNAALAVAAKGARAVALEYDRRRVAAADAIIDHLRKVHPDAGYRLSTVNGSFPEVAPPRSTETGKFIAVMTNVMGTLPSETEDQMIDGLKQFDAAYVDLQRFGNSRSTAEEYAELLSRFSAAGLTQQTLVLDQGPAGHYYRLSLA